MSVSVILTCFNRARYIGEAIESVLNQLVPADEIMVVDDGSTDGSQDVVRGYADRGVQLIEQPNRGPSAARNTGIKAARSEYVLPVDSDDMLLPHCIETLTQLFQKYPTAGLVHGLCRNFDEETGEDLEHPDFTMQCLEEAPHETREDGVRIYPNTFSQMLRGSFLPVGGTLVPKRVFLEVGLWDEAMWVSEDRDVWLRIARKYAFVFKPVEVMRRRFHSDNLSTHHGLKRLDTIVRIARKAARDWPEISDDDADWIRRQGADSLRMLVRHHVGAGEGRRAREYLSEYSDIVRWNSAGLWALSFLPGLLLRMLNAARGKGSQD